LGLVARSSSLSSVRAEKAADLNGRLIVLQQEATDADEKLKRPCSLSSVLPWPVIPEHGVEDDEELAGNSDEGDHLGLTGGQKALVEELERGVVAAGAERSHEEGRAGGGTAAADRAFSLPLARLTRERRKPGKAGDLGASCGPICGERQAGAVAPNVLSRTFEAFAPNRKWIADFTYNLDCGRLALCGRRDRPVLASCRRLFDERGNDRALVTDDLVMAIWRRGKPDARASLRPRQSIHQRAVPAADGRSWCRLSMGRSGNVWNNVAMESFFSSLKTERTAHKAYRSREEAKTDVFDYIERLYNAKRRQSTIGI